MRIDKNGNVGIGTTDPGSYRLKVQGDMDVTGTLTYSNVTTLIILIMQRHSITDQVVIKMGVIMTM